MDVPMLWPDADPLIEGDFLLPLDLPFTPEQAAALGVSRQRLRQLMERGHVRRVLRGVYAASRAPDDLQLRAQAAALVVPPGAIATDRTAAWLHGVALLPRTALTTPPPIEVFRVDGPRVRRDGVASGVRGLITRDIMKVHGVLVTTPLRTACDLGRLLWRFDALAGLDGMLRLGVPQLTLLGETARFKGYRGVRQLRLLAALADPRAESPAESALRLHWYDAGLPEPVPQHWVDGAPYRLDLALPELRYAAEYDGEEFHSSETDRLHDLERREWLRAAGWTIDVFTKHDVYGSAGDASFRLARGVAAARRTQALWTPQQRNHNRPLSAS